METQRKNPSSHPAVQAICTLLPKISDENLIRLTQLGQLLTSDTETLRAIAKVRYYLQSPGHPAKKLFRRVLDRLPAKRRVRLFETLFNGAWFVGNRLRNQAETELGFRPPFIMILSPTYKCNLRCKGCYTLGYSMQPELPLEGVYSKIMQAFEYLNAQEVIIGTSATVTRQDAAKEMDAYAAQWGRPADEIWQREYVDQNMGGEIPCTADAMQ